jgi:hypothetical protein
MNVSGLVVTLVDDPASRSSALDAIRAAGPFTLGDPFGSRYPTALETPDERASHDWHDWLVHLQGVVKVDLAFVSFDSPEGFDHV